MKEQVLSIPALLCGASLALAAYSSPKGDANETPLGEVGNIRVALTNTPSDVHCVQLTVRGVRTDASSFPVTEGETQLFRMTRLPVGEVEISAAALAEACEDVSETSTPTWLSEVVAARIGVARETAVGLTMIHNEQAAIGLAFDDN
jgi:hypothetical protein